MRGVPEIHPGSVKKLQELGDELVLANSDKATEELYVSLNLCGICHSKGSRKTGQKAKIDRSLESTLI